MRDIKPTSRKFLQDHFGLGPERVDIKLPTGETEIAYLLPSRAGLQPVRADKVDEYVCWMTGKA
tara:strand:+ start:561 stop:752 length:192 start_codon:yes stop_codon:yes gene_type:complete